MLRRSDRARLSARWAAGAALGLITWFLTTWFLMAPAAAPAHAQTALDRANAKQVFGDVAAPPASGGAAPEVFGGYVRGCLAGARRLARDGVGWQAVRTQRNRHWGHPDLLALIERLGAAAQTAGWPGVLVGDLAQPIGGPMRTGHRSHQTGIDGDIWLTPAPDRSMSEAERNSFSPPTMVRSDRMDVIPGWSDAHHAVIRAASEDAAVARIFVNAAIKRALCERADASGESRDWLRKVRPWWGHDRHFHVRLHCPADSPSCENQDPPPPGDGCGDALAWWFSDEALNPKPRPSAPARQPLTVGDLPPACRALAAAAQR